MEVAAWRSRGEHLTVPTSERAHRLFAVQEGTGPDLLLLHGFPTSSWDWARMWPTLVGRFRCLALDLLGFGFSDKPRPHAYSIREQADLVEGALDVLGIEQVHVLAHDYGDTVVQELVARDRERPRRRVRTASLLNGALFPETQRLRPVQRLLRTPLGPWLVRNFGRASFYSSFPRVFAPAHRPSRAELDDLWSMIAAHDGARVLPALVHYLAERRHHRRRWAETVLEPPIPLQLVNGSIDPVSGAHVVARFRELGGIAAVEELPDVGHYPHREAPERVLAAFLAWQEAIDAGM